MPPVVRSATQHSAIKMVVLAGVVLGLGGCKLVDQKTFNPQAGKAPQPYIPPAPVVAPIPPLIELIGGTPAHEWEGPVDQMTRKALARKPAILFVVKCLVPASGNSELDQLTLVQLVQGDGQAVAQAITHAGAPLQQVEITAMPDSTVTKPLIRVYVQ
ncbi:hypothetical protein [Acetobacter cibinongensis]|uniref:Lipoprotein n=1 Tax=Acetobacter cibinongensis TaxID=146475 RepID=A0A1Z5YRC9_9PROT|nr:hypothetical protein [Acetobacter cibinongensis]OUI98761.1 hypothetical protein HK14_15255 [Acetobacter cibinongensis]